MWHIPDGCCGIIKLGIGIGKGNSITSGFSEIKKAVNYSSINHSFILDGNLVSI